MRAILSSILSRAMVKWALLGLLAASVGGAAVYFVRDYIERGITIDSVETTQEQNERFSESVEKLTEQKERDREQINEAVEAVEESDEMADPELVRLLKRLL